MNRSVKKSYDMKMKKNLKQIEVLPPIRQARNININLQKRQKLSQSLTKSLVEKFNDKTQKKIIENEVNQFLKKETVTKKDLKDLEKLISQKIRIKTEENELSENLIKSTKPKIANVTEENKVENVENKLENTLENKKDLNVSGMSGGSDLDKFDGKVPQEEIQNKEMKELEQFRNMNEESNVKKVEIDKSKYNDEWDAINMYNKRMFEERRKREKQQQWEAMMKNRAQLLEQIQDKMKRKFEQEIKDREYDEMMERNLKKLQEIDKKQKEEEKQKAIKEKEIRDKQIRDSYVAKRIAFLKNKKYEKELIEQNNEEIKSQKEVELARKAREHEALLKTLKDNELHKQKLLEEEKLERENDIKIMQDAVANDIKRENERKAYYESIKRGAMEHDTKMLESVIKKRNEKLEEEDRIIREYQISKELLEKEKEERRKKEMNEMKIKLNRIYDKQVANKKARKEYEKQIDLAQGKIWEQDYQNYIKYQNETNKRIRELNEQNIRALDNQVKFGKRCSDVGMSETEKAINKDLLDKALQ